MKPTYSLFEVLYLIACCEEYGELWDLQTLILSEEKRYDEMDFIHMDDEITAKMNRINGIIN